MSKMVARCLLAGMLAGAMLALSPASAPAQLLSFPEWYTLANAAANNRNDEIAYMLRRGDNPNFVDPHGRTPISYAAALGNTEGIKRMLDNGARVDYRDGSGSTALHWAAQFGRSEVIRLLLNAKAPVDAVTKEGVTPLMMAAGANKPDAVRLLLEAGADTKKQDYTGRDAPAWAAGKANALQALQMAHAH